MSKIILFNSPKNVGKSKAIEYLNSKGLSLISAECKEALHNLTMTLFGVSPERYWEIYNTRELKEVPLPEFSMTLPHSEAWKLSEIVGRCPTKCDFGSHRYSELTIREAMIYVSEVVIKPRWGDDWFGQERVRKIKMFEESLDEYTKLLFCDDSCAFVDELTPLINYLGQENILLIRIHREGFTFLGDSRNYIPDGVITKTVDIDNNSTEQDYFNEVEKVVKRFLNEKNTNRL
jgi:hypothetical protein